MSCKSSSSCEFQHSAARRRLTAYGWTPEDFECFNTQPPEGGCFSGSSNRTQFFSFNTQPPEGGCSRY